MLVAGTPEAAVAAAVGSFSLLAEGWASLLITGGASLVGTAGVVSLILLVLFISLSCFCGMTSHTQLHTCAVTSISGATTY